MSVAEKLAESEIRLRSYATGHNEHVLCPKCGGGRSKEKSLSVFVDQEGGAAWNCKRGSCGWTGNVSSEGRGQVERIERPTRRPDPIKAETEADEVAVTSWFHKERGISRETVLAFGVRAVRRGHGELAVAFPYLKAGTLVNVKYRSLTRKVFAQEPDCERTLFNVDGLTDNDTAIFVEGELDVMALHEAGFSNGVTLPDGAPAKVQETPDPENRRYIGIANCADLISHITKWIIAGDKDGPGDAHAEELSRRIGKEKVWLVTWPEGCKDANETLLKFGADGIGDAIAAARPHPIKSLIEADQFESDVLALYRAGRSRGVSTGWSAVDQYMTIRPGELSIVTGLPGSGKSEWVDALMVNLAASQNWSFAVCSFENPPDEHISKWAEKRLGLPFWDGPVHRMSEAALISTMPWIKEHFLFIRAEDEAPTGDWIIEKGRAAVMRRGIRGMVVDPYNEIEHKRPANMTETEYVSQFLSALKRFAQSHGVHVWLIAHPAKMRRDDAGKIPVPTLYDVAGSANFVNKADLGIVVSRDWNEGSRNVDIHIKKVRFKAVGRVGIATLVYDPPTGRYGDPEGDAAAARTRRDLA